MVWLLLSIFNLTALVLAWATNWLVACLVNKDGNLPRLLSWYQTPDSNCFGANGDAGFRDDHAGELSTWIGRYRVCREWLNRNKANGVREKVLGFTQSDCKVIQFRNATKRYSWDITVAVNRPGSLLWLFTGTAWQFHGSWYWSATKRTRWNFGWKLNELHKRQTCMIVFSPSPYCNR